MNDLLDKEIIKKSLGNLFSEVTFVRFAYLFGSYAEDRFSPLSDIDLALYTDRLLSLKEKLHIIHKIVRCLNFDKIDLTFLNERKNLILVEKIIRKGDLFFCQDKDEKDLFEIHCLHQAIDFRTQRDKIYELS